MHEGLDDAGFILPIEIGLRFTKRHVDENAVELRYADLEDRDHRIGLDARRDAKGRGRPPRCQHRDRIAHAHAELLGHLGADGDAACGVEPLQRAAPHIARNAREALDVFLANAAHQGARLLIGRGDARRALHHGNHKRDSGHLLQPLAHRVVIIERRLDALQKHMAIDADDLAHQLQMEAIHHGHDDNQRRHAQHDSRKGKARDDRDKALGPPRAQIA